jgi:thymidylate synthase (FAD)
LNRTTYIYGDEIGSVSVVDYMGNDKRACHAARVSLLNDDLTGFDDDLDEGDTRLLAFLAREQHTSPFEHSTYSVRVTCPLFVSKQIMRHRTFSFNEVSRRYTSKGLQFYVPSTLRQQAVKNLQCSTGEAVENNAAAVDLYEAQVQTALMTYEGLIEAGVCREQARGILPQCLYTEFYMTGNLLNWFKFLRLRLHPHAQPEVQAVAQAVLAFIRQDFPETARLFINEG